MIRIHCSQYKNCKWQQNSPEINPDLWGYNKDSPHPTVIKILRFILV